ncbi:alpha/beta hydrolase family protein [Streptomyces sp. NPDC056144]|uniref:alpha/beta hydrolase family protein n=1 Tax=unclassified Streptomyces TaxID=2593676 RepID=UPI0035D934E2
MIDPEIRELHDASRPHYVDPALPRPVRLHIWHPPMSGDPAPPVVLVSHGSGGAARQMAWLAEPLAEAGFLAVAVDHHGNNFVDGYLPQGFTYLWERPRDLRFALDVLAAERPLGPVGAAGFSAGGYTSAALVGAVLDGDVLRAVVDRSVPLPEIPEFPDLIEALHAAVPANALERAVAEGGRAQGDERVRAAFLVCPGAGDLVTGESLAGIDRPVGIRWGDADTVTPPGAHALRYLADVPGAEGRSAGATTGHYDFLGDNPDGADARRGVAADAVAFFRTRLGRTARLS